MGHGLPARGLGIAIVAMILTIGIVAGPGPSLSPASAASTRPSNDPDANNPRSIVYLVDASGSMMEVFPHVKDEINKSVDKLQPSQPFNVIFFHDELANVASFTKKGLAVATADNKAELHKFVANESAHGGTQPLDALKRAFADHPAQIQLLTDGFDNVDSYDNVYKKVAEYNKGKATRVNTIFLKDEDDPKLQELLERIARDNGGKCVVVNKNDL